ncbi:Enoyl reductase (ER) domain-containing protein [Madurella fahalii]|uniref:Enoyl reductase (ER) domain-containing protein n=1 Tax=Madurella fahalii TaxID=1157608 RepID=A0ABQ0GQ88_9PEZI
MAKDATNLAAVLHAKATDLVVEERPIPSPGSGEILIRHHAIAVNPIDTKRQALGLYTPSYPVILGNDVSGIVAAVGLNVTTFKAGDRVIGFVDAFHTGNNDRAAFQTYSICNAINAVHLPDNITFGQGATLPTSVGTGAAILFDTLKFPLPSDAPRPLTSEAPILLIWGGASATGMATIQLARLMGFTVYATASARHHSYLRSLGASVLVDYRSPTAVEDLVSAAEKAGKQILYAVDTVSTKETLSLTSEVLSRFASSETTSKLATLLPWPADQMPRPAGIESEMVYGNVLWDSRRDLAAWLGENKRLTGWLEQGVFVPPPCRVIEGGVGGLQKAIDEVKAGVSRKKVIVEL